MQPQIPKEGDIVQIETLEFSGKAKVVYINKLDLYKDYLLPIQVEFLNPEDLNQFYDNNNYQLVRRFGLSDIVEYRKQPLIQNNETIVSINENTNKSFDIRKEVLTMTNPFNLPNTAFQAPTTEQTATAVAEKPLDFPVTQQDQETSNNSVLDTVVKANEEADKKKAKEEAAAKKKAEKEAKEKEVKDKDNTAATPSYSDLSLKELKKGLDKIQSKLKDNESVVMLSPSVLQEKIKDLKMFYSSKDGIEAYSTIYMSIKDSAIEFRAANRLSHAKVSLSLGVKGIQFVSTQTELTKTIYAKEFFDTLAVINGKKQKQDVMALKFSDTTLEITSNRSKYKIPLLAESEFFPNFLYKEPDAELYVNSLDFKNMINDVVESTSKSESRPVLTGVNLTFEENRIMAVATDSHRLSRHVIESKNTVGSLGSTVIPAESLNHIMKILHDDVDLTLTFIGNNIIFSNGTFSVLSATLIGNYPDTNRLIPSTDSATTTVNIKASVLSEALSAAPLFYTDKDDTSLLLYVSNKGECRVASASSEHEHKFFKEDFMSESFKGEHVLIRMNHKYLNQSVRKFSPQDVITFNIYGHNRPMVMFLKDTEAVDLDLILPIRLPEGANSFDGTFTDFMGNASYQAFDFGLI